MYTSVYKSQYPAMVNGMDKQVFGIARWSEVRSTGSALPDLWDVRTRCSQPCPCSHMAAITSSACRRFMHLTHAIRVLGCARGVGGAVELVLAAHNWPNRSMPIAVGCCGSAGSCGSDCCGEGLEDLWRCDEGTWLFLIVGRGVDRMVRAGPNSLLLCSYRKGCRDTRLVPLVWEWLSIP